MRRFLILAVMSLFAVVGFAKTPLGPRPVPQGINCNQNCLRNGWADCSRKYQQCCAQHASDPDEEVDSCWYALGWCDDTVAALCCGGFEY